MYNPIFTSNRELGNYIYGLELFVSESSEHTAYPTNITADVTFSSEGVDVTLYVDGVSKTFSQKCNFGDLYTIRSSDIVISGRMPYAPKEFTSVGILPTVVTFIPTVDGVSNIKVDVKSPLKASVAGNEILFDIVTIADADVVVDLEPELQTINGIHPDDNGNITIVSKSTEVVVNVVSTSNEISAK
jgi:hypothetical protein